MTGIETLPSSHPVRVTRTTLADGRELIYYDDSEPFVSGGKTRELVDRRELPKAHPLSEMRRDPLTGAWTVMAAHRMDRTFMPAAADDPLSPTRPGGTPTEIPADDYDVVVFENRFPSLAFASADNEALADAFSDRETLVPTRPAIGRCEVVCFTPELEGSFVSVSPARARTVIEAWAHRTRELSAMEGVAQVVPFENRGEEIGVTLPHPHGQIYAFPFLPPRTRDIVEQAMAHRKQTGGDLFDTVLAFELDAETRVVAETDHFVAFVPAAAKWPLEVMVMPKRAARDFAELTDPEKDELAPLYLDLLGKIDRFFPGVAKTPYIAAWNQAPVGEYREYGRLHLQLFSLMRSPNRMKFLASSESAMGAWINDTTPERIAQRLREV